MTREDAINMLYGIQADNLNLDDAYTKDKYDALTMAIKALEQEPKTEWIDGLIVKVLEEVDGGTDDRYIRYGDICDRVEKSIREYCGAKMEG